LKADGKLPFVEKSIGENRFLRKFSSNTKSDEFSWHRDAEDREIVVISNSGDNKWRIQLDNSLPEILAEGEKFLIKMGEWHRVIPGSENLEILVIKKERR